jgi:Family of unknown function (DUF6928)
MGAKTWMLVYAAGDVSKALRAAPALDRDATRALVARLHPRHRLTELADGTLLENANPDDGQVYAGCFGGGLTVLCTSEVGLDYPSHLDRRFLDMAEGRIVYLHAMHSVVDWFAYAIWTGGELTRALSLSPESGILENIGQPLSFEASYWAGEHPVDIEPDEPPYALPFHPLELAEDALRALFGFTYEGDVRDDDPDLEAIPLAGFAVERRSGWRAWIESLKGKN